MSFPQSNWEMLLCLSSIMHETNSSHSLYLQLSGTPKFFSSYFIADAILLKSAVVMCLFTFDFLNCTK